MPPTALLFPGQGSHHEDMDAPWREHPVLRRALEVLGFDPFVRLHEGTAMQQPALLICSLCAWSDDTPEDAVAAAGHSLGEYAALVAAGVRGADDAVRLVAERGAAMDAAAKENPGGMTAFLGGDPAAVMALAGELSLTVANDNAPGQLVLSGALADLDTAEARATETGARARRLDVAGAFHSPLMAPAADRLTAALEQTPFAPAAFPVFCNSTAAPFTDPRAELAGNLLKPVRWRETLLALRASGVERFVELGPGNVLSGLVKRTLREVAA
jgi:malonyl CoA-acyl carrier protein transacylase